MTEAEKAFEKLQAGEWVDDEGIEEIRKALQRVDKTWLDKKAAMADAAMVCKLTDENKKLKAKSQGLLKALKFYSNHFPHENGLIPAWTEYGNPQRSGHTCSGCGAEGIATWPNWENIEITHKRDCAYLSALECLATFNSDETEVGL